MTGLSLSRLGYGCYGLGGAYGRQIDVDAATELIHTAYDLGIRFFDTSDNYGAEDILGRALGSRRTQVVLASKVGAGANLSREHIVKSCDSSLRRLATDYLDLYQIHYDDPGTPVSAVVETLERLKEQGKIRAYGLGHLPNKRTREYLKTAQPATVLAEMSAAFRDRYRELHPLQRQYDFGIIAFSITGRGLLTGTISSKPDFAKTDIRRIDPLFKRAKLAWGLKIAARLGEAAQDLMATPAQLAIAWVLHQPGVASALTGPVDPRHLRENCAARDMKLDPTWLREFQAFLCQGEAELSRQVREEIHSILSSPIEGHQQGVENLIYVLEHCLEHGLLSHEVGVDLFSRVLALDPRDDLEPLGNLAAQICSTLGSGGASFNQNHHPDQ